MLSLKPCFENVSDLVTSYPQLGTFALDYLFLTICYTDLAVFAASDVPLVSLR